MKWTYINIVRLTGLETNDTNNTGYLQHLQTKGSLFLRIRNVLTLLVIPLLANNALSHFVHA